jgi:23S rRNA pseudouridine955/2504/2580 synthase
MDLKAGPEHEGLRLDRFLRNELPGLPVSALHRLARKKKILVNGRPVDEVRRPLAAGDVVTVKDFTPGPPPERDGRPGRADIPVLFEDAVLLVVDKPRGLAVHSGKGDASRTAIDLLRQRAQGYEPYLVHRLDKYTSGVLAVAKNRETAGRLGDAFRREGGRDARKLYLTVVFGAADRTGRIDLPLDRKPALTRYRLLQELVWSGGTLSLLEAEIDTGRTHQIRRHLAAVNLPVAGDDDYGNWELNKRFRAEFRIKHYLLHARELRFKHPATGVPMQFRAPIPREFYALFKDLPDEQTEKRREPRMNTDGNG